MEELLNTTWKSTPADADPLKGDELQSYHTMLGHEWELHEEHDLRREYKFTNFEMALEFVNKVGAWAEEKDHHPDLHLSWGRVVVEIWTHNIGGLAPMDFVWSAHVEKIYQDDFFHLLPENQ